MTLREKLAQRTKKPFEEFHKEVSPPQPILPSEISNLENVNPPSSNNIVQYSVPTYQTQFNVNQVDQPVLPKQDDLDNNNEDFVGYGVVDNNEVNNNNENMIFTGYQSEEHLNGKMYEAEDSYFKTSNVEEDNSNNNNVYYNEPINTVTNNITVDIKYEEETNKLIEDANKDNIRLESIEVKHSKLKKENKSSAKNISYNEDPNASSEKKKKKLKTQEIEIDDDVSDEEEDSEDNENIPHAKFLQTVNQENALSLELKIKQQQTIKQKMLQNQGIHSNIQVGFNTNGGFNNKNIMNINLHNQLQNSAIANQ